MKNSIVQYAINKKRKQVGKRGRMFTAAAGALMLGAMSLLTACSSGTSSGTYLNVKKCVLYFETLPYH